MKIFVRAMMLIFGLALVMPGTAVGSEKINIGYYNEAGPEMTAQILGHIVQRELGYDVGYVLGTNPVIFAAMDRGKGDIDIHVEVWLPNQESFNKKYVEERKTVAMAKEPLFIGRQGYCIPRYVQDQYGVKALADLADPSIARLFDSDGDGKGEVWVGPTNWASTNFEHVRVRDYGLADLFEQLETEEAVEMARLDAQYTKKEPHVAICWAPSWVFKKYDLVWLDEPSNSTDCFQMVAPDKDPDWFTKSKINCAYPPNPVFIEYTTTLVQRAPDVVHLIDNIQFDLDLIAGWVSDVNQNGRQPAEVAEEWIAAHPDVVAKWLGR